MRRAALVVLALLGSVEPVFAGNTEFVVNQEWYQDCGNPNCTFNRFQVATTVVVTLLDPIDIGTAELRCRAQVWRFDSPGGTCEGGFTIVNDSGENHVIVLSQPQPCTATTSIGARCTSEASYRGRSQGVLETLYPPPPHFQFMNQIGNCLCPVCGGI